MHEVQHRHESNGFIREPRGTLNSMTTGGKSHYYLTDAAGNGLGLGLGLVDNAGKRTHICAYDPRLGRFTLYAGGAFINNRDPTGSPTWS